MEVVELIVAILFFLSIGMPLLAIVLTIIYRKKLHKVATTVPNLIISGVLCLVFSLLLADYVSEKKQETTYYKTPSGHVISSDTLKIIENYGLQKISD